VLARAARLAPPARVLLEAVAVVPPRPSCGCSRPSRPGVDQLDECLARGMLQSHRPPSRSGTSSHAWRSRTPSRRSAGRIAPPALAALAEPPTGAPDAARLAHHAEAAGDAEAVLRHAPQAAARAAALGAHREAAAQYARALRFGERLAPGERAELHEARSRACYVTDQNDAAIEAIEEALALRRPPGPAARRGRRRPPALADPLVSRPHGARRARGARRGRAARAPAAGAGARLGVREPLRDLRGGGARR
jgi:hypothetical protein